MGEYIKSFIEIVLLFVFMIWLYFVMVANAPEETPETPKDTKQVEIIMKG